VNALIEPLTVSVFCNMSFSLFVVSWSGLPLSEGQGNPASEIVL